jgi:hypothetical protein
VLSYWYEEYKNINIRKNKFHGEGIIK